jgi:tetratricopeptide (TPR) repeat protein
MHGIAHKISGRIRTGAALCLMGGVVGLAGCQNNGPKSSAPRYSTTSELDEAFEKGANRPPTAETMFRMGRIYAAQGKDDEAYAVYRNTIARFPHFLPAYSELAQLQVRQRKVGGAIVTLQDGLKYGPKDAVLHNDLGMCHVMNGDYEKAADSFASAVANQPDDARYKANQAMAMGMAGRYDESLNKYQEVLPPAEAHYNLAVVCEARNDMDRANEEYAKALALNGKLERKPIAR